VASVTTRGYRPAFSTNCIGHHDYDLAGPCLGNGGRNDKGPAATHSSVEWLSCTFVGVIEIRRRYKDRNRSWEKVMTNKRLFATIAVSLFSILGCDLFPMMSCCQGREG